MLTTLHLPKSVNPGWSRRDFLGAVAGAIVLYRRDLGYFQSVIGSGRLYFIRHGVDCNFFRPPVTANSNRRILIVGHWLRDWATIQAVLEILEKEEPAVGVDVVASPLALREPVLAELIERDRVVFRPGLSDRELLHLYQRSALMLCPFVDTGASNAIVEALASGLPIVTNDVGGVPDYGGGSVFEVARAGSTTDLAALCLRYLFDARQRAETSKAQRDFAEKELNWPKIAEMHLDVYADSYG